MTCYNNKRKTCRDKSCQRFYNNASQAFLANTPITLTIVGSKVVDTGLSIETESTSMTTVSNGLYHIAVDMVATTAADGAGTLVINMDGTSLPCTLKSNVILPTGSTAIHTETDVVLDGCRCAMNHVFTVSFVGTVAGTVNEFCMGMTKLA